MGDHGEDRWRARPVLAGLTRAALLVLPLLVALLVVRSLHEFVLGGVGPWVRLGLSAAAGIVVALLTERATRRLLPLPALLRMSMLFPGRAPSRLLVTRRASSSAELRRMLEARDPDPQQAAIAMMALIGALAAHDKRSRGHSERVRLFTDMVAAELALTRAERDRLCWSALLHDVGKLEIAVAILNKPGTLNASEWDRMRRHPADGARLCASLLEWLGPSGRGILEHHEKYDGSGYPHGLAGEQISLAGRVISVVDAYETMTAARPYRKPVTTRVARQELASCASSHFDPVVVKAFLAVSVPRMMWATGPLSLLTHLPYLRELQLVGTQVASVSASSAAQVAGVAALAVGTTIAPIAAASAEPTSPTSAHQPVRDASAHFVGEEVLQSGNRAAVAHGSEVANQPQRHHGRPPDAGSAKVIKPPKSAPERRGTPQAKDKPKAKHQPKAKDKSTSKHQPKINSPTEGQGNPRDNGGHSRSTGP